LSSASFSGLRRFVAMKMNGPGMASPSVGCEEGTMIADCHPFPVAVRARGRQVRLSGCGRGRWRPAFARVGKTVDLLLTISYAMHLPPFAPALLRRMLHLGPESVGNQGSRCLEPLGSPVDLS